MKNGVKMARAKSRLEKVTNKFGTTYTKRFPAHHAVSYKVAKGEVIRWKDIIKMDEKKLEHAKEQLKAAGKERFKARS